MKILSLIKYAFFVLVLILIAFLAIPAVSVKGNYKILTVLSGSMEPAIHTGSVVAVFPQGNYEEGDVITYKPKDGKVGSITHRIVKTENSASGKSFTTKGDANNAADINPVSSEDIIGKVLFSVPYIGYAIDTAKRPAEFALLMIVPAGIIIFEEILKIIKEVNKMKAKE